MRMNFTLFVGCLLVLSTYGNYQSDDAFQLLGDWTMVYRIVNTHEQCLDVDRHTSTVGIAVCNGSYAQQFRIAERGRIFNRALSSQCLSSDMFRARFRPCSDGQFQRFSVQRLREPNDLYTYFHIYTSGEPRKYLVRRHTDIKEQEVEVVAFQSWHDLHVGSWSSQVYDQQRLNCTPEDYPVKKTAHSADKEAVAHRLCILQPPIKACGCDYNTTWAQGWPEKMDMSIPAAAKRYSITVQVDHFAYDDNFYLWYQRPLSLQCANAYAEPGETVVVQSSGNYIGGLQIIIGVHTTPLQDYTEFWRPPVIQIEQEMKMPLQHVRSPYGGIVCFRPVSSQRHNTTLVISNVILAPHYILGKTSDVEWREKRAHPAPWTLVESDHHVWFIQSRYTRAQNDMSGLPVALENLYRTAMQLSGLSETDDYPHKLPKAVPKFHWANDISVGGNLMTAGDPIQMSQNMYNTTDVMAFPLTWAHPHELGHLLANMICARAFGNEVANNIFSLRYIHQFGQESDVREEYEVLKANARNAVEDIKSGNLPTFQDRYRDEKYRELLVPLVQLTQFYGYGLHTKVYRQLREEYPQAEAEEIATSWQMSIDTVFQAYSRQSGFNLEEFFTKWQMTPTAESRAVIAALNLPPADDALWGFTDFVWNRKVNY